MVNWKSVSGNGETNLRQKLCKGLKEAFLKQETKLHVQCGLEMYSCL